jgi:hypothetical protein
MPFFDQPMPPAMSGRPPYENEVVKKWTTEIARSDGFIFVTPEYNYGPSAVLKNAPRLALSGMKPQDGCLCELWQCHGRSRRPAAPLDGDRASARSGPLVRLYQRRNPVQRAKGWIASLAHTPRNDKLSRERSRFTSAPAGAPLAPGRA